MSKWLAAMFVDFDTHVCFNLAAALHVDKSGYVKPFTYTTHKDLVCGVWGVSAVQTSQERCKKKRDGYIFT